MWEKEILVLGTTNGDILNKLLYLCFTVDFVCEIIIMTPAF